MGKIYIEGKGYYDERNTLNDKTGSEWIYSTKSVLDRVYTPSHQQHLRSLHGGCKPPLLCKDIIEIFTKKGQIVLDPFAGVGGTLLGATECEREALGIEINPHWKEIYEQVCDLEQLKKFEILVGDSRNVLKEIPNNTFDFVLTDPEYYNMDKKKKTRGKFKKVGEDSKTVKSKLHQFNTNEYSSIEEWLDITSEILCLSAKKLKPNKYMAVFMGDMYINKEYYDLGVDLSKSIISKSKELNTKLIRASKIIWFDDSKRLKMFGYPTTYITSVLHTDILIFRKGDE